MGGSGTGMGIAPGGGGTGMGSVEEEAEAVRAVVAAVMARLGGAEGKGDRKGD